MTTTKPRNWSKWYDDTTRHRTLKQSLILCSVVQSFSGWFELKDAVDVWRAEVGPACERTVRRYLTTLEMIGVVEVGHDADYEGRALQYRWAGWPEPIKPPGTY